MTIKTCLRASRGVLAGGLLALAGACSTLPAARIADCGAVAPPAVTLGRDGRSHVRLDVMTYNIEGLGWPARKGRAAELKRLGKQLAALRAAGEAPDVIAFQEVFSRAAVRAVKAAGYPAQVAGPSLFARRGLPSDGRASDRRHWREGELGIRMASSGLAIVSRYPIVTDAAEPFSHRACAGLDCLSNKGALLAAIAIPGVPDPVQVFDSHMNSRRTSRAPLVRSLASHHLESRELADFIAARGQAGLPTVLAGDFNMRHSQARFSVFEKAEPLTVVQRYCRDDRACRVDIAWPSDTPWLDTEDLQLFRAGARVDIRPVRVEPMFDGGAGGAMLSDHPAQRVTYDLSWPAKTLESAGVSCNAGLPQRRS